MNTAFRIIMCLGLSTFGAGASATDVLVGKQGMTLYTFDKDSNSKSACVAQCLAIWPPAQVGDVSGKDIGEIVREDGLKQPTYRGKPLYYYVGDKKPGDSTGDNVKNVWHVVPAQNKSKSSSNSGGYDYGNASSYSY